jgi:hypothetical protein
MRGWRSYFGFCETPEVLVYLIRMEEVPLRTILSTAATSSSLCLANSLSGADAAPVELQWTPSQKRTDCASWLTRGIRGNIFRVMLEREMEDAVSICPDLFIEPGLTLVRRQAVINGRRPDLLFSDSLSRDLLVELQCGRLDEEHLQQHFYYYFDYRAKYPSKHLRLMFIANRLVPQHKEFLDEHGYEFREVPEQDFERRVAACSARTPPL